MFTGLYTALITPFKDGKIDYNSLEKIIEQQIKSKVDGLVVMGTTGESPTVSFEEHKLIISKSVEIAKGRTRVIAGTGSNSTKEAICLSESAEKSGADGILSVNPYYNKPTQKGLIAHFKEIANSISIPVILYNIPGRTAINFLPESTAELLEITKNIKAMKEATGDISQMMRLIELCGDKINILSGDDNLLLPVLSIGGTGIISVLSNIIPAKVKEVIDLFMKGDFDKSRKLFYTLLPLCRLMFIETNPIPIKSIMAMASYCSDEMRLPLLPMDKEKTNLIKKALNDIGVEL